MVEISFVVSGADSTFDFNKIPFLGIISCNIWVFGNIWVRIQNKEDVFIRMIFLTKRYLYEVLKVF